mgnify:FL=1
MLEIFKFYINLISKLIAELWGNFKITDNVNYLSFFIASIVLVVFISILKLSIASNGINTYKQYKASQDKKENKGRWFLVYFFYDLNTIANFPIFESYNILLMSDFQRFCVLISVNTFYLLFLLFVLIIIYKSILWIRRILF